jgi:class III poly(R)-hydroxyalkanoic acid synthase PhaE subunit
MDWAEYTKSMTEAWVEAQKTLWETWAEAMVLKPKSGTSATSGDISDIWSQIAEQQMETWRSGAAPITKATAEQFLSVGETSMRFLEFSARIWEALGPEMEAEGDWSAALEKNMETFREQLAGLPGFVEGTAGDINILWQQYLEQWDRFGQPWTAALQQAPEYYARMMGGDSGATIGLSNLYRDAYQQTLARLVASPGLGMTREFNEKFQLGFDAWVSWQLATVEYQGVLNQIWDQAIQGFQEDIVKLAEKGQKIESLRDFVLLWTRGAEDVFTEAFRTEAYVLAQGQMLNAAMTYRIREREIIEVFLKLYDLPTRSELDETHRRIYESRKESKVLRSELKSLQAQVNTLQAEVKNHKKTIAELATQVEGGQS